MTKEYKTYAAERGKNWWVPFCGTVWTSFVRWALEFTRLETAEGGGSNSFSSMLASFTNVHDVPSRTILFSTFRVIILPAHIKTSFYSHCWALCKWPCTDDANFCRCGTGGNWHLPQVKQQHTHEGERALDLHRAGHNSDQLKKKYPHM